MKAFLALLLLCIFLTGCAAQPYAGSAKCMEQADIAYETDLHKNEPLDNECKATKVNTSNKEFENHSIVDRSLLQLIVSVLNGIFR
ncbi:hypothetical protein V6237_00550 [Pseudoalteromonas carrageenovora]|uniref:hypothetical protein n=1 Tax=Pseudoalteromonas carrageenovora TaxID=227 RepID=UPI003120307F